jgi:hypothetical protein
MMVERAPAGAVNDQDNASTCTQCPDGKVAVPPAVKCLPCRAGQTSSPDHTHCMACVAGYYNPSVAGTCMACPAGTYSERQSMRCLSCPAGTFNNLQAQSGCRECPSGSYCPTGAVEPSRCPTDNFCEAGAAKPSSCQPLFSADSGSSSCRPSVVFYVVIGISAGAFVVLVLIAWVAIGYRRPLWKRIKKTYRHHQRHREYPAPAPVASSATGDAKPLIPEPLPGPVYAGL